MSTWSSSTYALGFAEFLAGLLPPGSYSVIAPPHAEATTVAAVVVRNLAGERFLVRVEHLRDAGER